MLLAPEDGGGAKNSAKRGRSVALNERWGEVSSALSANKFIPVRELEIGFSLHSTSYFPS